MKQNISCERFPMGQIHFLTNRIVLTLQHLSFSDSKKENPPKRKDFLKKSILDCQQEMQDAYLGIQNAIEPDLIDRYIYELNALNKRYTVLMQELRELDPQQEKESLHATSSISPLCDTEENSSAFPIPTLTFQCTLPEDEALSLSERISSTNRETETSLLNRSFK